MKTLNIAIGSMSQDKHDILAERLNKKNINLSIVRCDVSSGISDQPTTEEETIAGAKNRAKNAFENTYQDNVLLAIGLEGGLKKIDGIYNLICCASIFHDNHWTYSLSSLIQLPPEVSRDIDDGCEFGERIREYHKTCNHQEKKKYQVEELISRKASFGEAIDQCFENPAIIKIIAEQEYR